MKQISAALWASLLVVAASIPAVHGQVLYGSLVGSVVDPSRAPIVGAMLSLENSQTGLKLKTSADDRGDFAFRNLPEGVYGLKVNATGFQPFS
jgi:hypothetical protein